jgi:hypothetical protein
VQHCRRSSISNPTISSASARHAASAVIDWPRAVECSSGTVREKVPKQRRKLSLGFAKNCQPRVPVRESRMRRCQGGNVAPGFR